MSTYYRPLSTFFGSVPSTKSHDKMGKSLIIVLLAISERLKIKISFVIFDLMGLLVHVSVCMYVQHQLEWNVGGYTPNLFLISKININNVLFLSVFFFHLWLITNNPAINQYIRYRNTKIYLLQFDKWKIIVDDEILVTCSWVILNGLGTYGTR
jgi:hypothetical protein